MKPLLRPIQTAPKKAETYQYLSQQVCLPQGQERWVVVRSQASIQRAMASMQRQAQQKKALWGKKLWYLSKQSFTDLADALQAFNKELEGQPHWSQVHSSFKPQAHHQGRGRPRKDAWPPMLYVIYNLEGSRRLLDNLHYV